MSDIFADLRDGSQLLNLLEVMSGQPMVSLAQSFCEGLRVAISSLQRCCCDLSPQKRQKGRGVFQQRANVETALNFLKKKSVS